MPARRKKPVRPLASLTEAAAYAGVHRYTIYRWILDGRIAGYRCGPKLLKVDLDELDDFITPVPVGR
jgi:excisionase family DNA binding protein